MYFLNSNLLPHILNMSGVLKTNFAETVSFSEEFLTEIMIIRWMLNFGFSG